MKTTDDFFEAADARATARKEATELRTGVITMRKKSRALVQHINKNSFGKQLSDAAYSVMAALNKAEDETYKLLSSISK